ncbi:MAG: hypothetical protein DYG89_36050 [Caldilinea sp. CFX5]|nr:hypothetical protein [Caldilinea sp. CFX5]
MMKRNSNLLKLAAALCLSILLLALSLFIRQQEVQPAVTETSGGIALQPPAFLKAARAQDATQVDFGFLVEEAGITAYTKLDQELDWQILESRFKTIGRQTDQFISGIMVAPGYEKLAEFGENAEVQVFLHYDGWIVAYLTRWQPAAAMFDWVNYDDKRLKDSTLLENVVRTLALDGGATNFTIAYYDFRNPEATSIALIADRADDIILNESFQLNIPRELTVYESSWSYSQFDIAVNFTFGTHYLGSCTFNEDEIKLIPYDTGSDKWKLAIEDLSKVKLAPNKDQKFSVTGSGVRAYCGVAIVYREAIK